MKEENNQQTETVLQKHTHELELQLIALHKKNEELLLAKEQAENILEKHTELFDFKEQFIVENTDDILWVMNPDFSFIYVSPSVYKFLGYTVEEHLKQSLDDYLSQESVKMIVEEFKEGMMHLQKKEYHKLRNIVNREIEFIRKDKTRGIGLITIIMVRDEEYRIKKIRGKTTDITAQKRTEEALRDSAKKWQSTFDGIRDSVFLLDTNGKILQANKISPGLIGKKEEEILTHYCYDVVHNCHFHIGGCPLIRMKLSKQRETMLMPVNDKWFEVTVDPILDEGNNLTGAVHIVADITERKLAEKELIQSEAKFRSIFDKSPVGSVIVGLDKSFIRCNAAFCNYLNYKENELIGKKISDVTFPEDTDFGMKEMEQIVNGEIESTIIQKRYLRKDGGIVWCEVKISLVRDENNKPLFFLPVIQDITTRKQAEQDLIKAKEKAEESERLKSAFLANMSHEIRTPMNGILGFAWLLKQPLLSGEEQQEYISLIEKSGTRMLNIINDVVNISKVESGLMNVSLSVTDINEQIDYIYNFFRPEAKQKGIHISVKNSLPAKEAFINTDKEKVYAILTNLVKNAIKFTSEGSIELGCDKKDNELEFYVKDSGIGIPQEQKEIIFERFRQGSELLSRKYEGAGLGLSISKAYVEMLGGKIWVESEYGKGTVFYFTIPYLAAEGKPFIKNVAQPDNSENKLKNLKILIADDDEISEILIKTVVKTFAKEIINARTGIEAVEACRNNPDIDLVLIDVKMPEMDGYEATRKIRQFNNDVVIIVQTAFGLSGDKEKAIAAGCNDYILKPINKDDLRKLVKKHLKFI